MTVAVNTSGSQTCTVPTEHVLATISTAGVFQLALDVNASLNGTIPDLFVAKVYGKARTGDTERLLDEHTVTFGAPACPLWVSKPYISPHHIKFTLNQTQGSSRAVPWAVYET